MKPACSSGWTCDRLVELGDLLEQAGFASRLAPIDLGAAVADGAIDEPCADRVHPLDPATGRWSADRARHRSRAGCVAARVIVSAPATRYTMPRGSPALGG